MFPCPDCARFIRPDSGACPFCDHVMVPSMGSVVAGALLGLTLTACGGETTTDDGANGVSSGSVSAAAYAAPEFDTSDSQGTNDGGGSTTTGSSPDTTEGSGGTSGSTSSGGNADTTMDGSGGTSSSGPEGSGSSTGG